MRLALLTSLFLALGTIVFGQTTGPTPSETVTTHYPVSNVSTSSYHTDRSDQRQVYNTTSRTKNIYNYYPDNTYTVANLSPGIDFITTERRYFEIFGRRFAVSIDSLTGFMQGVAFASFIIYIVIAIRRFQGK